MATGKIFTDGACQKAWFWPEATRADWGFAKLQDGPGGIELLVYGALPGPSQSSPRAELYVFLQVLSALLLHVGLAGPIQIYGPPSGPRLRISGALERPYKSRALGGTNRGTRLRPEATAGLTRPRDRVGTFTRLKAQLSERC
eukprot:6391710-Pyramimonas_sp.AAC.1